jgi:hypothetical protein
VRLEDALLTFQINPNIVPSLLIRRLRVARKTLIPLARDDKRSTRRKIVIGCIVAALILFVLVVLAAIVILNLTGTMPMSRRGGPTATPPTLPDFPWPPKASTYMRIPLQHVSNTQGPSLLKDVSALLENAFRSGGYKQTGYYGVNGGFALVSQLEQFKPDGRPADPQSRWSLQIEKPSIFTVDYISTLIKGKVGRFRVIVFAITTDEFFVPQDGKRVDSEQAYKLAMNGASALPLSVGNLPVTDRHTCWALVYEFEKTRLDQPAEFKENSAIAADVHLQKILPYLQR